MASASRSRSARATRASYDSDGGERASRLGESVSELSDSERLARA